MNDDSSQKRHHFRYRLRDSGSEHYIYLDAAINKLGIKELPEIWGVGPEWKQHPFFRATKKDGKNIISKYKIGSKPNEYKLRRYVSKYDVETNQSASIAFRSICQSLVSAAKNGSFTSFHDTIGHVPKTIPPNSRLWENSWQKICYTGKVFVDRGDGIFTFCEVMFDRLQFDHWLHPSKTPSKFLKLTPHLLDGILQILTQHSLEFVEPQLWTLIEEATGGRVHRSVFKREIWKILPPEFRQAPGPPKRIMLKKFDDVRPQLLSDLRSLIAKNAGGRATEDVDE